MILERNGEMAIHCELLGMQVEELKEREGVEHTIYHNAIKLCSSLPHNSPIRRSLIHLLSNGLSITQTMSIFGVSESTVKRARKEKGKPIIELKYKPYTKRPHLTSEGTKMLMSVIDDLLPTISGRDWRLMTIPNDEFYRRYVSKCHEKGIAPMSQSYVIYNILSKLKIHHSRDETMCNLCKIKDPEHLEIRTKQMASYFKDKELIASGSRPKDVMIIQDFSQIQIGNCGFYQDLVVCIYFYNATNVDKLERKYFHFVGKAKQKHHEGFVLAVWEYMLVHNYLKKFEGGTLHIWSDGGPKHFKLSSGVYNFYLLANTFKMFHFIYNYFPSYHGHGICDTVVAQAKKELNLFQRIGGLCLQDEAEIVEVIATITNHFPVIASPNYNKKQITTLDGIKSFHKFTFTNTFVCAYYFSQNTAADKIFRYEDDKTIVVM
jgi:hypothetical protein